MKPDSSVPCAQQPDPCTILSQINPLHALPSFFLKIRFNNITIRSSAYVLPSVWPDQVSHPYKAETKLQFCIYFYLSTTKYSGPNGSRHSLSSICFESLHVGRDGSVGIATRYGLDGQGIESRWGRDIPCCPDRLRGPPSLLHNEYRVSFPGIKRPTHLAPRLRKE
jgi:hypothetical protein